MNQIHEFKVPELMQFRTTIANTIREVMPQCIAESHIVSDALDQAKREIQSDTRNLIKESMASIDPAVRVAVMKEIHEMVSADHIVKDIDQRISSVQNGQLFVFLGGLFVGVSLSLILQFH